MLGLWIDSLTDEEKDRIVSAQGWTSWYLERDGEGCLIGHARGVVLGKTRFTDPLVVRDCYNSVGHRFNTLVRRFGLDRVVRAIKLRAGADVGSLTPKAPALR